MYKLYIDKNELFEASIELKGASLDETFARLVMNTDKWDLVFEGHIDRKGNVEIPIKKLKHIFSDDVKGNLKLEVVADETFFTPWQDEFELLRSKELAVEVKENKKNKKVINETSPKVKMKETPKSKKGSYTITDEIAKDYLREIVNIISKSKGKLSKKQIKKVTKNFIKENKLRPSTKNKLYGLVQGKQEVIRNAVRNIR